jgi:hypothetical protein
MKIREITPFLHASLYHYRRFESFEDIQSSGLHEWGVLSKENVKQIMLIKEQQCLGDLITTRNLNLCNNSEGDTRADVSITEEFGQRTDCFPTTNSEGDLWSLNEFGTELMNNHANKKGVQGAYVPCILSLSAAGGGAMLRHSVADPTSSSVKSSNLFTTNTEYGFAPGEIRERSSLFSPRKQDSLFWSIYIAKYGVGEFFEIGSKYMNKEIEEKSKIMEFMKVNRPLLKSMKITSDKGQEIMGDLMTNKKTGLTVICAFALFYQVRIWIVSEESRTYFEFLPHNSDDNTPVYVIHRSNSSGQKQPNCENHIPNKLQSSRKGGVSYRVDTNVLEKTLIRIRDEMFQLESPTLHMKGISNYKITDLEKIIEVLGITRPTEILKWKKTDMYNAIRLHCMTAWLDR